MIEDGDYYHCYLFDLKKLVFLIVLDSDIILDAMPFHIILNNKITVIIMYGGFMGALLGA